MPRKYFFPISNHFRYAVMYSSIIIFDTVIDDLKTYAINALI